jgi:hypothetical protein
MSEVTNDSNECRTAANDFAAESAFLTRSTSAKKRR